MPEFLPAITLWQPWATLVAEELKPLEFRGWAAPEAYRHRRIAIHAGARPVRKNEIRDLLLRLHSLSWRETGLVREGSIKLLESVLMAPGSLPLSSVLCTAILGEPIRDADLAVQLGTHFVNDSDRAEHTNWGWPLTAIERLQPFVPAKGQAGILGLGAVMSEALFPGNDDLDRDRIEKLAQAILEPVRDNFRRGPHARDRAFEALNALAFGVAAIIVGTGEGAEEAWAFFDQAVEQNVVTVRTELGGARG